MNNIGIQLHSNGDYWQAKWRRADGQRAAKSLGHKDRVSKSAALRACQDLAREHILDPGTANVGRTPLLTAWKTTYLAQRAGELKEGTFALKTQAFAALIEHFGDVRLDRITRTGAADFRAMIAKRGVSAATVSRYIRDAKEIFKRAKDQDLVRINPFDRISGSAPKVSKTWAYISADQLTTLLDSVPSPAWRALVGLARLAGLRRGEALRLKADDIDLVNRTLRVFPEDMIEGTKQAFREVPIVPALAAILREAMDAIPEGEERPCWSIFARNADRDMRVYIKRAGIPSYKKPLHTLRKNLESDWLQIYPHAAVIHWMGHSAAVAAEFYHKPPPETVATVTGVPVGATGKS